MRIKMGAGFIRSHFFHVPVWPNRLRDVCRRGRAGRVSLQRSPGYGAKERHRKIVSYVLGLTKAQLQQQLINTLEELDSRDRIDRW